MTNKSLHGEDEIATRGVKSYTMAPVRARKTMGAVQFLYEAFYTCTPLTVNCFYIMPSAANRTENGDDNVSVRKITDGK